jgi:LEA14-like dessication related protein
MYRQMQRTDQSNLESVGSPEGRMRMLANNRMQARKLRRTWLFFLASCCLVCSQGCTLARPKLQAPVVTSVSVQFKSLSPGYAVFLCQLTVDNPNEVSLPVRDATVALAIAGLELANGELAESVSLPPKSKQLVNTTVYVDLLASLGTGLRLLASGSNAVPYTLSGYVDIGIAYIGRVRFDEQGTLVLGNPGVW